MAEVLGTGSVVGPVAVVGIVAIRAFMAADTSHPILLHHTVINGCGTPIGVDGSAPTIFTDVEVLSTAGRGFTQSGCDRWRKFCS